MNYASSHSSTISTDSMQIILERLRSHTNRSSTEQNYLGIWRNFNSFIIKLDKKPENWEDRICLYGAYLVDKGIQSATLKSYYSAIKAVLRADGYLVDDNRVLLVSLSKACRLINDRVKTRLPIRKSLLEMILFEIEQKYAEKQPFLEILFKSLFLLAYYGLFRIGELAYSQHSVKAVNVHIGENKDKMLFILYTSKTHGLESKPQKIKITAQNLREKSFFCPFRLTRHYLAMRGNYYEESDQFFVNRDNSPVTPSQVRKVLRNSLKALNLSPQNYGFHGFRAGRCTDMVVSYGKTVEQAKFAGRWKSNAVYKYIKC